MSENMAEPGERSINEIITDLSKPIAGRHVQTKKRGGKDIAFVSWFYRIKYLDLYAPGWHYEIREIQSIGGKLVITVRITIPTKGGDIYREATGQEDEAKDTYGNASSNAEAMALCRATAKFGLGLSLYAD